VTGQQLHRGHVELVDVGPLLAVHLDRQVLPIEHRGDGLILEGLALHDVAPVAGGVADREEDRHAARGRLGEGLGAPGPPVHRVVGVLPQVRAPLQHQPVGEAGPTSAQVVGPRWIGRRSPRGRLGQAAVQVGGAGRRARERIEHASI
jgi:hypothetical protein